MSPPAPPLMARIIVRAVAWLVPAVDRAAWREEWQAELFARSAAGNRDSARRALGAIPDAWLLRFHSFTLLGVDRDFRWAWRGLTRTPSFTVASVATLALGIGATAALFSLVDGVLVRPLAYPEPERLVRIDGLSGSGDVLPLSRPDWRDWTEAQSSFVGIASHLPVTLESVLGGREPARLRVRRVSWNFFAVLGVPPERGRWFNSDEEGTGAPPLAIMSYGAHTRLFGEAADTATRVLDLLGEPHTVVGVMPRDFQYIEPTDVWILHEREEIWEVRAWPTFGTAGRLRSGVSLAQAAAEMDAIARAGREAHGDMTMARRARLTALQEWVVGGTRRTLMTLFAAAGFVLLVACANLTSGLMARGTARTSEVALRRAIGATRWRVVREMLVESALLSALGCTAGLLLAGVFLELARLLGSGFIPRLEEVRLNTRVAVFVTLVGVCVVPLFGLWPALVASRSAIASTLRSLGRGRRRSWSLLIGAEVAAATTLLVGAGLLLRSVFEIRGAELGWDPTDLIVAEVALPPSRYPDASSRVRWTEELRAELKSIPGVRSVGTTTRLPLEPTKDAAPVYTPEGGFASSAYAGFRIVDSGYFDALSIALLEGRTFTDADASGAPDVAVVSESLARKLWPDGGAIGQRLRSNNDFGWSRDDEWLTVVGVVANVRHWRMAAGTQHEIYVPFQQRGERTATMSWVVRHNGRMGDVAPVVRDRIGDMDADVPITLLGMDDQLIATYRDRRFTLALLGLFGGTVTMLALIGIVGVVSYAVERRRREIGIRLALGARTLSVRRGLQAESLLPALVGAAVGLVAALALTRAVAGLLYEVRPVDPATYLVVPVFLLGATWLASLVPARRALRVDPARVLRGD